MCRILSALSVFVFTGESADAERGQDLVQVMQPAGQADRWEGSQGQGQCLSLICSHQSLGQPEKRVTDPLHREGKTESLSNLPWLHLHQLCPWEGL